MEGILLRDKNIFPDIAILRRLLGGAIFGVYEDFMVYVTAGGTVPEWRYYNDSKAWLCKGVYKKKTVFWLSVWEGFFRVSFFFTEKTREGITALDIAGDIIKDSFAEMPAMGKLKALVMNINSDEQLGDLCKIFEYKKSLK